MSAPAARCRRARIRAAAARPTVRAPVARSREGLFAVLRFSAMAMPLPGRDTATASPCDPWFNGKFALFASVLALRDRRPWVNPVTGNRRRRPRGPPAGRDPVTLAVAANRPTDIPESHAMSTVTALPTDPILPLRQAFERMRSAFRADMAPSLAARRDRLSRLARMTRRHAKDIIGTISADFGHRSPHETLIADLLAVDEAIKHARRHLARWMRPQRIATRHQVPARVQPIALAAARRRRRGGAVELSVSAVDAARAGGAGGGQPRDDQALRARAEDRRADGAHRAGVLCGGRTGGLSGRRGGGQGLRRIAVRSSVLHRVDGGRPPGGAGGGEEPDAGDARARRQVAGDRRCRRAFESIAPKIAIGKLFNAGQTCIAPDYALVPRARADEFAMAMMARDGQPLPDARRQTPTTRASSTSATTRASRASSPMRSRAARAWSRSIRPGRRSIPSRARWPRARPRRQRRHGGHARGDLRPAASGGSVRHARRRDRLRERARSPAGALLVRRRPRAAATACCATRSPAASPSTAASRTSPRRRSRSAASARAEPGRITASTAFAPSARKRRCITSAASASCRCSMPPYGRVLDRVLAWFALRPDFGSDG